MSTAKGRVAPQPVVLTAALLEAGKALSATTGAGFVAQDLRLSSCQLGDLSNLFGSETHRVAAAFFEVGGDLDGFLLLLIPGSDVEALLHELLGPGPYEGGLARSAIGELGNIVGSSFLNHLADTYSLSVSPTPPQVVYDIAGALLNTLAAGLAVDNLLTLDIVRAQFSRAGTGQGLNAYLLWLPREKKLPAPVGSL